jgi:hypothetical protein
MAGKMWSKSTEGTIHSEKYSIKMLNSHFLLDEQAKQKHGKGQTEGYLAEKSPLYLIVFTFLLVHYTMAVPSNPSHPHKTKKGRLIPASRKLDGLLEPSRGQWLSQGEMNAFEDASWIVW